MSRTDLLQHREVPVCCGSGDEH